MNYFDILLAKKLEDDRDPKVEGLSVTENGRYHEDGVVYDPVIVNVPETPLSKLTVTENGTYTAPSGTAYSEVDVDVPLPENAYLLKEIEDVEIASFTDGSDLPMSKLEVAIEPVQDLHGYDAPWVGGAGKNKFDATESSRVVDGVTFTANDDGTVVANGTSNATVRSAFLIGMYTITDNTVLINGCPSGGASNKFELMAFANNKAVSDYGNGASLSKFSVGDTIQILAIVRAGYTANNLVFKPMIRLATETDDTFAPYSNICPISGWSEANVGVEGGQNLYNDGIVWKNNYYINASGDETQSNNYKYTQTFIEVEPSTTYSIQADIIALTDLAITVPYYSEQQSFISRDLVINVDIGTHTYKADFTTPSNCKYIRISVPTDTTNIVIYKKKTYTIDLDGTRYGGKVDLVSGVMTVDRVSLTVDENSNIISESGGLPFRIDLLTGAKASSSASALTGVKCNFLKEVTQSSSWGVDGTFSRVTTDAKIVYFKVNSEITTIQQLKTFLQSNNLQLVYELETPITIQLSPTVVKSLRGRNNVFADSGNILDLSYLAKEE